MIFTPRPNSWDAEIIAEVYRRKTYLRRIPVLPGDRWLDVGAHIGCFSIQAAELGATVVAYEPDDENFGLLQLNVGSSGLISNIMMNKAVVVGGESGTREFYVNDKRNKGTGSLLTKRGRRVEKVLADNVNDILKDCSINKIKLDCEGAELEILYDIDYERYPLDGLIIEYHFNVLKDKDHKKYFDLIDMLKAYFKQVIYSKNPKKSWTTLLHATNKPVTHRQWIEEANGEVAQCLVGGHISPCLKCPTCGLTLNLEEQQQWCEGIPK